MRGLWILVVSAGVLIIAGCRPNPIPPVMRIDQFIPIVGMPAPNGEAISYDSASQTLSGTVKVATPGALTASTFAIGVATGSVTTNPTPHEVTDPDPTKQLPTGAVVLTNVQFSRLPNNVWRWQGTATLSPSTSYQVVAAAVEPVQEPGGPVKYMASTSSAPFQTVQFIPIVGVSGETMMNPNGQPFLRVTIRFSDDLPATAPVVKIFLVRGNLGPDGHPSPGTTDPAAALPKASTITLAGAVQDPTPHTYHWDVPVGVKSGDLIVAATVCNLGSVRLTSAKSGLVR